MTSPFNQRGKLSKRRRIIDFNGLFWFNTRARKEIDACAEAGAYLAGCVLVGAMTETLMMLMLRLFPSVVYRRGKKLKDHWGLKELDEFARDCGWFDQATYEAAERIRICRNLLHPNWYAARKPRRITKGLLTAMESDFSAVMDCVTSWVV